jgi:hypothetical protein
MIERRTPGLLLICMVVLCALALPAVATAQAHPKAHSPRPIRIRVDSVLGANTGKGMDAQLASTVIGSRLKALFEYSTYQLVQHQQQQTHCGRMVAFQIPGGRILHIVPRAVVDNMISMELVLFEGTRPLMTTDLKLMNHAVLIVGGPRYHQGMLITLISTDAPEDPDSHPDTHRKSRRAAPPSPSAPDANTIPAESPSSPQN